MKKFEITWWEQRRVEIDAEDMEEAFEILNAGEEGEYVKSDNYDCKEIGSDD